MQGDEKVRERNADVDTALYPHSAVSDRDIIEFLVSGTKQAEYLLMYRPEVEYVPTYYYPGR